MHTFGNSYCGVAQRNNGVSVALLPRAALVIGQVNREALNPLNDGRFCSDYL
jgi:hypothetical protein